MTEIIRNLDIDTYHSSRRLSSSKLGDFADGGPRLFAMRHIQRTTGPRPDTDAMRIGRLFEDILQGRQPDWSRFAVKPDGMSFASKEGKAWKAEHEGREIISASELEDMKWMTESVHESDDAVAIISGCEQQVSFVDDFWGPLGFQARPDWVNLGEGFSLDLKTCESLGKITSGKSVREYRYHVQAAIVRRLAGVDSTYLLAVEKRMPYRCQLVEIPDSWLDAGDRWIDTQLAGIERCITSGEWPRVSSAWASLPEPPPWL